MPCDRSPRPTGTRPVVVFVTNRAGDAGPRRRTASGAPSIGSPETCSTPSTSRRMAAMTDSESIRVTPERRFTPRSEIELRTSRSSGPGVSTRKVGDAGRSRVRRRGIELAVGCTEAPGHYEGRSRPARDRPGRAQPAAQQGASRSSAWSSRSERRYGCRDAACRPSRAPRRASAGSSRRSAAVRSSGSGANLWIRQRGTPGSPAGPLLRPPQVGGAFCAAARARSRLRARGLQYQ